MNITASLESHHLVTRTPHRQSSRFDTNSIREAAKGKWRQILAGLGIDVPGSPKQHGPCPACGGKDRFRFDDKEDRGTWFCNQCNPRHGDGFALIQNVFSCDFHHALTNVAREIGYRPVSGHGNQRGTVSYDYTDQNGQLLFQVLRFDPKDFRQRRPNGRGGWIWNLDDIRRPLYHLPNIIGQPDDPIVFHEGEKAVEAAIASGLSGCHTTTAGGARAPRKTDFSSLKGRHVIVCPDHDTDGEKYLCEVAVMAQEVEAASVKVLRLPGLPVKGDIVEWLEAGGTAVEFAKLLGQAEPIQTAAQDADLGRMSVLSVPFSSVWPEIQPVKAELLPVTPLPLKIVPASFQPWVRDVSDRMQCPPDYVAAGMLVMTGSIIGAGCGIRPKKNDDWTVVPNLWGGIVGRPSMLKTPAIAEAMKPLDTLEREAKLAYDAATKDYTADQEAFKAHKESLLASMRKVANGKDKEGRSMDGLKYDLVNLADPAPPIWRRFKTNDATVEKLAVLQSENPRGLLIFRDELIGLLATWDKDGHESDRSFFLEGFNGLNSYTADRIGRGHIYTPSNTVSLFGGIQPAKLNSYLYAAMRGHNNDGLVQRLQVLVYPDEPATWTLVDTPINTVARQIAQDMIQRLVVMDFRQYGAFGDEGERVPYYRFDEEGQQVFYEWWRELETKLRSQEDEPILLEHLGKYRSLMPSLALIFHLLEVASAPSQAPRQVSAQHARCAAAWCDYLEQHARRIYGLVMNTTKQAARRLAKKLQEGGLSDGFAVRDIQRKDWSLLDDRDLIEKACEELVAVGWLREKVTPSAPGYRGKTEYLINPKVKLHG